MSDFSYFDIEEPEKYVIDSNDRIEQRLLQYQQDLEDKKRRDQEDLLTRFYNSLEYDEEGKPIIPMDEEGYALVPVDDEGNPLVSFDEEGNLLMPGYEPETFDSGEYGDEGEYYEEEEPSQSAQEIIDNANAQAEMILQDAQENAQSIFEQAKEDGYRDGYNEGVNQAASEYEDKQRQLEEERDRIFQEYNQMRQDMEKDLVDVILEVVDRTFRVMYSDSREIILFLVDNTLLNIDNSKTYLIRVNEKNQEILQQNKESLQARVGSDAQIDIIGDPLMDESACMIETDGGIFDCGMDVQMTNLIRSLRALNS